MPHDVTNISFKSAHREEADNFAVGPDELEQRKMRGKAMKRAWLGTMVFAVLVVAQGAWAQLPSVSYSSQTYQPLVGGTVVTLSSADDGSVLIPLQFSFPFLGANYTQVRVQANGFLTFGTTCASGCYSNTSIPGSTAPNSIFPWWDDHKVFADTEISYLSTATDFDIQWKNLQPRDASVGAYSMTYRIKLTLGGTFFVSYGSNTDGSVTPSGGSASMGFQGGSTSGMMFAPPPGNQTCGSTCTVTANWPANTVVTVGQPMQADLLVSQVVLNSVTVVGGGNLQLNVSPTFRNIGLQPATNFLWRAYLSTDRTFDGSDTLLFTSSTPLTAAATSTVTGNGVMTTTTPPPPGQYYVLIQADSSSVVTEASEVNNYGSTDTYFQQGIDLIATAVSGPATTGPGNMMTVNARFQNLGTNPAGTVTYKVVLSTDPGYSTNDFVLYTGSISLTGGQTVNQDLTFAVPLNVSGGELYYVLVLDPDNTLAEASEANNFVASVAKVTVSQAELANLGPDLIDPQTGVSTRLGFFGQPTRLKLNIGNAGGADGRNFKVGVVVSRDLTLSLLTDTLVYEQTVAVIPAGSTGTPVDLSFTMPLNDRANMPFVTGQYYLFVLVDSSQSINETNEGNNNIAVNSPVRLAAPAPDLTVLRVDAPASAGVGEIAPVYRVLKNVGNVASPEAKYRYFASANTIITPDDVPLSIVTSGTPSLFGTVTLGIGQSQAATDLVQLPASMAPGAYYIGVLIDSDDSVVELDETNNGVASPQIQVASSSLKITTTVLPDAIRDRPYSFRLIAQGEQGASTWSIDTTPGAGGLPAGLQIDGQGLITGTPTAEAVASFTAQVSNAGRQAAARLVLRVLPITTELEVTTVGLPPVINSPSLKYDISLGASGGVKPYAWRVASGTLPGNGGISLSSEGALTGSPKAGSTEGNSRLVFEVTDALGTKAQRELTMRVVAPGSIIIAASGLNDALVNVDYATDISARNADSSPLARPLTWRIISGRLPEGVPNPMTVQDVAVIAGTPTVAGVYQFTLQVEDAKGRTDTADLQLRVYPARLKVTANQMPTQVRPGDEVSFSFSAPGSGATTFKVFSGSLPAGLALSADGTVSGTVADDALDGTASFIVEAVDASNASGLGAFGIDVNPFANRGGCAAAPSSLWLLAMSALPLLRRRRAKPSLNSNQVSGGRLVGALALAACVLAPSAARAQDYQLVGPTMVAFAPLQTGVNATAGSTITLPYQFVYFGTATNQVAMSQYGYLSFAGNAMYAFNSGVPSSSTSTSGPTSYIAAWWDGLGVNGGGQLRWQTTGVAPRRSTTFEWSNVGYCSSPSTSCTPTGNRFSFQIILFEGTNQIRMAYGPTPPTTGSASVGVQRQPSAGIAALSCTTSSSGTCSAANWQPNSVIDLFLPPDVSVSSLSADQTGYAGVSYRAAALVKNTGGRTAIGTVVRFYLSADTVIDSNDPVIGDTTPRDVLANDELLISSSAPIPNNTTPGTYYLLSKVDPDMALVEQNENNNVGPPNPISIGQPTADLVVTSITAPASAAPGGMISVPRVLQNIGNADAAAFKYTFYLSDNESIGLSDRVLGTPGSIASLAAKTPDSRTEMLTLPNDLVAGRYWVGACVNVDPATTQKFGINEISVVNNCTAAPAPTIISTGALSIITTSVPAATQYSPWGVRLQATGGTGSYVWSVKSGSSLPPGIGLSREGDLQGNPQIVGTTTFEVQATSGAESASVALSLQVSNGSLPLVIPDQELTTAEFSRLYNIDLVATGGKPAYTWALKADSRLPIGLNFASDGHIEGAAYEVGDFSFGVEVTDSAGVKAAKDLRVRVVNPTTLHIATSKLATAYLRKEYTQRLQAVGGKAPYTWAIEKFQRLPENLTEEAGDVKPGIPMEPDFGIALDDGVEDFLRGVPKQAGLYALSFRVTDGNGSDDFTQLLLRVSYEEPLAITTTALPDAFMGHEYAAKLSHNGGAVAIKATFSEPCLTEVTGGSTEMVSFICAQADKLNRLPEGIKLADDGTLSGTPTAGIETNKVYNFFVKVTDDQGRQDVRSLSIRLRPDYNGLGGGGCSGAGAFAPLALSAVLLFVRRRGLRFTTLSKEP